MCFSDLELLSVEWKLIIGMCLLKWDMGRQQLTEKFNRKWNVLSSWSQCSIQMCDHSQDSYWAELSCDTVYCCCLSVYYLWKCKMLTVKWKLLKSTFIPYYLLFNIWQIKSVIFLLSHHQHDAFLVLVIGKPLCSKWLLMFISHWIQKTCTSTWAAYLFQLSRWIAGLPFPGSIKR